MACKISSRKFCDISCPKGKISATISSTGGAKGTSQPVLHDLSRPIIRFQTLHSQLTRAPSEDEAKAIFLAALQEPLQTMCVVLDFRTSIIDQVIDHVLEMDKNNTLMSMGALQRALPKEEELRFRQAVQCTTCLKTSHSTLECTMRT